MSLVLNIFKWFGSRFGLVPFAAIALVLVYFWFDSINSCQKKYEKMYELKLKLNGLENENELLFSSNKELSDKLQAINLSSERSAIRKEAWKSEALKWKNKYLRDINNDEGRKNWANSNYRGDN